MLKPSRRACARALTVPLALGVVAATTALAAPAQASTHIPLPFVKPSWATASADRGVVAADAVVQFELPLDLQDEAGAEAYATAVSTPGSGQYGQFLAPADWIARFAPTQDAFDSAVATLTAEGVTVSTTQPASREYVIASGTAAEIDKAFATSLHAYTVQGATRVTATSRATLPARLARTASAPVFGGTAMRSMLQTPDKAKATGRCSTYWGQHTVTIPKTKRAKTTSTALCGYTAKQLRATAGLGVKGGTTARGDGQRIAIIDAFGSTTAAADLSTFSSKNHLPQAAYSEIVPDQSLWQQDSDSGCSAAEWKPEQTLDLEAAHTVAPNASLLYVGSTDCDTGIDLALSTVLDQGLASIVSNSYDSIEEPDSVDVQVHQQLQAAGEGIGLYYASGDYGDNSVLSSTGEPSVGFPSSSPWVTAVGGTTVALDKHRKPVFTLAWGDDVTAVKDHKSKWLIPLPGEFALSGAGGGASSLFQAPWYQQGVVPASLSDGSRATTDVSALADPYTGFTIGFRAQPWSSYKTMSVGGTSLATPIVAAEAALAQEQAGHALGFVNPLAYTVRSTFQDVKPSSTPRIAYIDHEAGYRFFIVFGHDSSLKARKGYDEPTGLGALTSRTLAALARG